MSRAQTDNDFFEEKVVLRIKNLPDKKKLSVLYVFGGDGVIWNEIIKRLPGKNIDVLRIDIKRNKKGLYLKGDNIKYMREMDLNKFDVIDCDAYGIPFKQLNEIFKKKYKGVVFITANKVALGGMPFKMLSIVGYSTVMVKKCPSLFTSQGKFFSNLKAYLAANNVKKISYIRKMGYKNNLKYYACIKI